MNHPIDHPHCGPLRPAFLATATLLPALWLAGTGAAQAQPAALSARQWVWLGVEAPDTKASLREDPLITGGQGDTVRFQEQGGHPARPKAWRLGGGHALGESWWVEVAWSGWSSSGTAAPAQSLRVGETRFDAGAPLASDVRWQQLEVLGGYRLQRRADAEWGLLFGGGLWAVDITLQGKASGVSRQVTADHREPRVLAGLYGRQAWGAWGEGAARLVAGSDTLAELAWRWPLGSVGRIELAYRWSRLGNRDTRGLFAATYRLQQERHGPSLALRADF